MMIRTPIALAALIAATAAGAVETGPRDTTIGPSQVPSRPSEMRPADQVPTNRTTEAGELYQQQARQLVDEWRRRVAEFRRQGGAPEATRQLDKALVTVENSWRKLAQVRSAPNFDTERQMFEAAVNRLEQTWRQQVAEGR